MSLLFKECPLNFLAIQGMSSLLKEECPFYSSTVLSIQGMSLQIEKCPCYSRNVFLFKEYPFYSSCYSRNVLSTQGRMSFLFEYCPFYSRNVLANREMSLLFKECLSIQGISFLFKLLYSRNVLSTQGGMSFLFEYCLSIQGISFLFKEYPCYSRNAFLFKECPSYSGNVLAIQGMSLLFKMSFSLFKEYLHLILPESSYFSI